MINMSQSAGHVRSCSIYDYYISVPPYISLLAPSQRWSVGGNLLQSTFPLFSLLFFLVFVFRAPVTGVAAVIIRVGTILRWWDRVTTNCGGIKNNTACPCSSRVDMLLYVAVQGCPISSRYLPGRKEPPPEAVTAHEVAEDLAARTESRLFFCLKDAFVLQVVGDWDEGRL